MEQVIFGVIYMLVTLIIGAMTVHFSVKFFKAWRDKYRSKKVTHVYEENHEEFERLLLEEHGIDLKDLKLGQDHEPVVEPIGLLEQEKKSPSEPIPDPVTSEISSDQVQDAVIPEEPIVDEPEQPLFGLFGGRMGGTLNPDPTVYNVNYMNNRPRISSYLIGPL